MDNVRLEWIQGNLGDQEQERWVVLGEARKILDSFGVGTLTI